MTIVLPLHRALSTKFAGRSFNVVTRLGYNPWLARVDHPSEHNDGRSSLSRSQLSRIYSIPARTYATTAASTTTTAARKPAGRPKAHTGRTPAKRTTKAAAAPKKPGPKTAAGKARVGAKPKAKKAKATPKPKPKTQPKRAVKKAPSKSALNKERIAKDRALKETALLNPPKQLPAQPWQIYQIETQKKTNVSVVEAAKAASASWKNLTPEEKEHLNHVSHINKEKNEKAYKAWLAQFSPERIKQANNARHQLKRMEAEKRPAALKRHPLKYAPIKNDDRQVKGPPNAYAIFLKERHASGDFYRMAIAESAPLIGREWKVLSAQDKKKYQDAQHAELNRYIEEYRSVYGSDPVSVTRKQKQAAKA